MLESFVVPPGTRRQTNGGSSCQCSKVSSPPCSPRSNQAGRVDHGALGELVERLLSRGVTGISPLGSTGEGYSLGLDQRLAVTGTVAASVPPGTPVIPGMFAAQP